MGAEINNQYNCTPGDNTTQFWILYVGRAELRGGGRGGHYMGLVERWRADIQEIFQQEVGLDHVHSKTSLTTS